MKKYLSGQLWALYELIWRRFVASQMSSALIDQTTADIQAGPYTFRASGSVIRFKVFLKSTSGAGRTTGKLLPPLKQGQALENRKLDPQTALHPTAASRLRKPPWSRNWKKTASAAQYLRQHPSPPCRGQDLCGVQEGATPAHGTGLHRQATFWWPTFPGSWTLSSPPHGKTVLMKLKKGAATGRQYSPTSTSLLTRTWPRPSRICCP